MKARTSRDSSVRCGFEELAPVIATPAPSGTWSSKAWRPKRSTQFLGPAAHRRRIKNGGVQLVFNTTDGAQALADSRAMRRAALLHKVPYYTTLSGAVAAAQGIKAYLGGDLEVRALQSYFGDRA